MTALDLLRVLVRRWPIVALGLLVTAASVVLAKPQTVYWASVAVTVRPPADEVRPKTLEDVGADPIPTAVLLVQLVNGGHKEVKPVSPAATLYGEGRRSDTVARVRDVGGQWGNQVREPVIDIQAVSPVAGDVVGQLDDRLGSLRVTLTQMQDQLSVAPSQRMSLVTSPSEIQVVEVTGSRARAVGVSAAVGVVLTVALTYWVERVLRRRVRSRSNPAS